MGVAYNPKIVTDGLVFCADAANPKSYSPNVLPNSLDLFAWFTGTNGNCTIARDTTTAPSPAGGIPLKMSITGNDPYMATYNAAQYNLAPASSGQTWTASVWVKASTNTTGEIFIFGDSAAGAQVFTLLDYSAGSISITTEWTRVSFSRTFTNVGTQRVQVRLDGTNSGGTGIDIWWDGLQVERGSTSAFNPTLNSNGAIWSDISSLGRNLTINGSPLFNPAGYCTFSNNQTTEYIMRFPFETPTAAITYSCWFRSNFTSSTQTPFTYSVGGNNEMLFFINNSTQLAPHPLGVSVGITTTDMTNVWVNFSWTRDSSTGRSVFYRDGQYIGEYTASAGTNISSGGYLIIGQESDSAGGSFDPAQNLDGDFSRLDIYNRVLNAREIEQNFDALRGRYGI